MTLWNVLMLGFLLILKNEPKENNKIGLIVWNSSTIAMQNKLSKREHWRLITQLLKKDTPRF